jgi:exodeoxyribonuclease-5
MLLNDQQQEAALKAIDWYFQGEFFKKQTFVLGGIGGSGKTSMILQLITILGLSNYNVLFAAFTGKAVSILRQKGLTANTIHKTFYNIRKGSKGQFFFTLKSSLPGFIKLIVIDEFSMINDKMIQDILSFGIPVIFTGDPYQLPPVIGKNTIMEDEKNFDYILTKVMRQNTESALFKLTMDIRNGKDLDFGIYGNCRVCHLKDIEDILKYDMILCWKNSTRRRFNRAVRQKLNFTSVYPQKNEKLICMKTNYFYQMDFEDIPIFPVNGLIFVSLNTYKNKTVDSFSLRYKPEYIQSNKYYFDTKCDKICFDNYLNDIDKDPILIDDMDLENVLLDFAYCCTTHRAQGSEWNKVLLIDEFRGPSNVYSKWIYTAASRSREYIDIVKMI